LRHLGETRGCQFAVPDDELIEFAGQVWCPFHLPIRAGEAESEKAEWRYAQLGVCLKIRFSAMWTK
jgi:hypothetical protein